MEKLEIKYVGNIPIILHCECFSGIVKKEDVVLMGKKLYEKEFLKNKYWQCLNKKNKDKDKK